MKKDFWNKLNQKFQQIALHPEGFPRSREYGGIYKCLVSKRTVFFYRIDFKKEEIEIITLFDNRQEKHKLNE